MRITAPLTAILLTATTASTAVELALDSRAVDQAIAIGRSLERERTRFHAPYRLTVGRAPVDYIDIITPFRRVVLESQHQTRIGNRSISQRQAREILDASPGWIDAVVELTFHPLNAFVTLPPYDVVLRTADGQVVKPRAIRRTPRFGPRFEGGTAGGVSTGRTSQPLLGGSVIASFDGHQLPETSYEVVLSEKGRDVAKVAVDLGKLR